MYEIIGKLKDKGYDFSKVNDKIPEWVIDRIPRHYTINFKAEITQFPFT